MFLLTKKILTFCIYSNICNEWALGKHTIKIYAMYWPQSFPLFNWRNLKDFIFFFFAISLRNNFFMSYTEIAQRTLQDSWHFTCFNLKVFDSIKFENYCKQKTFPIISEVCVKRRPIAQSCINTSFMQLKK